MSLAPEVCIIKTDGINCDEELSHAFEATGARSEIVHINEIREGRKTLGNYGGLGLAGGFSYGDDIASGRILAHELTSHLREELGSFLEDEKPIIGICNGFQVLVKSGILPRQEISGQTTTLTHNDVGQFVCKWVDLETCSNVCRFVPTDELGETVPMQIAHGEGRFDALPNEILRLNMNDQVVFRYTENPNGSVERIAGICDESGLVLGMMPHPERSIASMHPDRSKTVAARTASSVIFNNFVKVVRGL